MTWPLPLSPELHRCVVADVSGMDGLLILHQAQGSHDSTDSGSLPPTYSRLPPDGHEFPEGEPSVTRAANDRLVFTINYHREGPYYNIYDIIKTLS